MNYMYHNGWLHIPKRDAICQQVIKMGDETIEGTQEMFVVHVKNTRQIVIQCSGRNTLSCNRITT